MTTNSKANEEFTLLYEKAKEIFAQNYKNYTFIPDDIYAEITYQYLFLYVSEQKEYSNMSISEYLSNTKRFNKKIGEYLILYPIIIQNYLKIKKGDLLNNLCSLLSLCKYELNIDNTLSILNNNLNICEELDKLIGNVTCIDETNLSTKFKNKYAFHIVVVYCIKRGVEIVPFDNPEKDSSLVNPDDEFYDYKNGKLIPKKAYIYYLQDLGRITKVLSREEETELFRQYKEEYDVQALDELVKNNLRFVVNTAKCYKTKWQSLYEDLIQEGNIALFSAIEKFDYKKGYKFSTYAYYIIRESMQEYISKNKKLISTTKGIDDELEYIKKSKDMYITLNGNVPSDTELARITGFSMDRIKKIKEYSIEVESYNQPIVLADGEELTKEATISDDNIDFDYNLELSELQKSIWDLLDNTSLTDQERKIIYLRFGFYDGVMWSLSDCCRLFGYNSRETVRKTEAKALRKLRMNKRSKGLADLLDNPSICEEVLSQTRKAFETNNKEMSVKSTIDLYDEIKRNRFDLKDESTFQVVTSTNYKLNRNIANLILYFNNVYSKEELYNAINLLSPDDMAMLLRKCGNNLDGTHSSIMDKNDQLRVRTTILKRLKNILMKMYGKEKMSIATDKELYLKLSKAI